MSAFQEFWKAYPKHVAPAEAERVFNELVRKGADAAKLISAARRYALTVGEDLDYVPSPHSWLKQGRYDDADLAVDEHAAQVNWLRQQYKTANVKAVENRYHISMPKAYPPDDMTDPDAIRSWYKERVQSWIHDVYRSKFECSPSTTTGQSSP